MGIKKGKSEWEKTVEKLERGISMEEATADIPLAVKYTEHNRITGRKVTVQQSGGQRKAIKRSIQ